MVTLRPRDSNIAAREAAAMPLPSEDTTPPVTNTNLVIAFGAMQHEREIRIIHQARGRKKRTLKRILRALLTTIQFTIFYLQDFMTRQNPTLN